LGKEAKRGGRIVLRSRKRRIEPEMVCWGNRPEGRASVSAKNDPGQIVAINGHGNGFAKLRGAEPGLFVFGKRRSGNLVKPYELRIEARACIVGYCRCFFLQPVEVFGVQDVDQMNFTTAKAQQFNVAIALNIESNGIEIGQRLSFLVFFPVVRVSPEKDG